MLIRSKAPLRIGLAGGGTDVAPYSDIYGGAILNATINLYAYATIEPLDNGKIIFEAVDKKETITLNAEESLPIDGNLDLLKGIYNRIVKDFSKKPLSFKLTTFVDAPAGSGLGTSSTLVTAILGAFSEWLKLPLGEYDLAHLAYQIEREDLLMAGGKQDQYAATFGGVNFMEFYEKDRVIVNPLRIRENSLNELSFNLLLYYTETSRLSSAIIEEQRENVKNNNTTSVEAMHNIKKSAYAMKEALLKNRLDEMGRLFDESWEFKRQMAKSISNPLIESIYAAAKLAGATGGRISGAGGGGFMVFYCPNNTRYQVVETLKQFGGKTRRFEFTNHGLKTWTL